MSTAPKFHNIQTATQSPTGEEMGLSARKAKLIWFKLVHSSATCGCLEQQQAGACTEVLGQVSGCRPSTCLRGRLVRHCCLERRAVLCVLTSSVEEGKPLTQHHIRRGKYKLDTVQIFIFGGPLRDYWRKENKYSHMFTHNDVEQAHLNTSPAFH